MSDLNPFKKQEADTPDPDAKVCPFIGNMVVPVMANQGKIVGPGVPQVVGMEAKLFQCQKQKCMLWSDGQSDCSIKVGMEALPRVEELLGPLASMFWGKR